MATSRTSMPKTSIDKYGNAFFSEKEIWLSNQIFSIGFPSVDSCPHKCHSEAKLCGPVIFASNGWHCSWTYSRNILELSALEPFIKRVDLSKTKIIPTVLLLKSPGMARYMARTVDHVYLPDSLIQRIQKAPEKVRECVQIDSETVTTLKQEGFSGVLLSTSGWEHKLPEIIEKT